MTDIPSYGQFIKDAKPPPGESLNELVEAALKTIVKQAHALAQNLAPRPDEDREAQIESVQQDMDRVLAEFGNPDGDAARRRMLCELLHLYRVCAFKRCRKSQCCRGDGRCRGQVDVPDPVFRRVVWLMMAARLPWITSGRANERVAYEAWVAAMEARGSRVGGATHSVSPRPACGERSDARSASG